MKKSVPQTARTDQNSHYVLRFQPDDGGAEGMTLAMGERMGISNQRGFWLCCLWVAVFLLSVGSTVWAKVEPAGPMHLWRVHGFFMNAAGKPIGNVEVTLQRDGEIRYRTKTDGSGKFEFDHVYGRYSLHIEKAQDYSQLSRDVMVGEAATVMKRNTLYVVAGPSACTDDCSAVFTSKNEFEKAVKRNTERP